MKKYILILVVAGLFIFPKRESFAEEYQWQNISRENLNLKCLTLDPVDSQVIYIGSDKGIFKSEDGGESWKNIFLARGKNRIINFLLFDNQDRNYLYTACANGLFSSSNRGQSWKRIFQGKNDLENDCTSIALLSGVIYLGTRSGLFSSKDKGRSWQRASGILANSNILAIAAHPKELNYVSLACIDGIFITQNGGESWERVFVAKAVEDGQDSDASEKIDDQDEGQRFSQIRYISGDPNNPNYLYLATTKGLYKSQDKGKTWDAVSNYGLLSQGIKFLLVSPKSQLYAVTKSGIFEYIIGRWQELSFGLVAEDIRFLALDDRDNLYAACDRGLFKKNLAGFGHNEGGDAVSLYCQDEPKIDAVQQAAIKYAEVEPEKIIRWRKQAARRAWLPKITVDMDRDTDRTVSNSIWGSYSNGGAYYIGPDDITKYNNKNWGVSLTWELGDLIFSDDQTNIDVRSRLMVELRDEILDEVTKLYFERIRTKAEIDSLSIEDRKKRFEKELKLQELTASIDALTGGYFSRQLEDKT